MYDIDDTSYHRPEDVYMKNYTQSSINFNKVNSDSTKKNLFSISSNIGSLVNSNLPDSNSLNIGTENNKEIISIRDNIPYVFGGNKPVISVSSPLVLRDDNSLMYGPYHILLKQKNNSCFDSDAINSPNESVSDCNNKIRQLFFKTPNNKIVNIDGKCLTDDPINETFTFIDCDINNNNQIVIIDENGLIKSKNGKCFDVKGTTNGNITKKQNSCDISSENQSFYLKSIN